MQTIPKKYAKVQKPIRKIWIICSTCQKCAHYARICNIQKKNAQYTQYAKNMQKICSICKKYVQYAKNMQIICRGPNRYAVLSICKICKKNAKNMSNMQFVHVQAMPPICKICTGDFTWNSLMTRNGQYFIQDYCAIFCAILLSNYLYSTLCNTFTNLNIALIALIAHIGQFRYILHTFAHNMGMTRFADAQMPVPRRWTRLL